MGATRIQQKSRVAKKVIGTAQYDTYTGLIDSQAGRKPAIDKKGFPLYKGLGFPVVLGLTVVDTTP